MRCYDAVLKMYFGSKKMQINVYGNSSPSQINDNKKVKSLFPQEPYLKTNYIESNIEDNIDLKNQFRIKILKAHQHQISNFKKLC